MKMNSFYYNFFGLRDDGDSKHWITPTLCIGNVTSSYEHFNMVVNANYPYNHIMHRKYSQIEEQDCTLFLIGLCDNNTEIENLEGCIEYLIPRLRKKYEENKESKFLFHCYAGKSRSVVLELPFMVEVLGMKFNVALELIKEKREIIDPRHTFIETLQKKYTLI